MRACIARFWISVSFISAARIVDCLRYRCSQNKCVQGARSSLCGPLLVYFAAVGWAKERSDVPTIHQQVRSEMVGTLRFAHPTTSLWLDVGVLDDLGPFRDLGANMIGEL